MRKENNGDQPRDFLEYVLITITQTLIIKKERNVPEGSRPRGRIVSFNRAD